MMHVIFHTQNEKFERPGKIRKTLKTTEQLDKTLLRTSNSGV